MDRKPIWINGRQIFVLPWARGWDALLAAPPHDFLDVWSGRACLADEHGRSLSPDEELAAGQRIVVRRKQRRAS